MGNPTAGKGRAKQYGIAAAALLREAGHEVEDLTGGSFADSLAARTYASAAAPTSWWSPAATGGAPGGQPRRRDVDPAGGARPCGTGNDIATSLGLPVHDLPAAVRPCSRACRGGIDAVRQTAEADPVGTGRAWFAGVLGRGFDANVNERANGWRWPTGGALRPGDRPSSCRSSGRFPTSWCWTASDQANAMLVAVGNGPRTAVA